MATRPWPMTLLAGAALLTLAAAPSVPAATPPDVETDDADVDAPDLDTADASADDDVRGTSARTRTTEGERLVGTFRIAAGQCEDGPVTSGSYFRMVQPGGDPDSGPYVDNGDSPCGDDSYTPLRPGSDGGLRTDDHQPHPDPAFDGSGNGVAERITRPESFFGTRFSTATNPTDPQTGTDVPVPEIRHDGAGNLDGDVRSFAAAWNGQHFNQGSPKPDGSRPGHTSGPTGTYDPATGAFTLEWASLIRGGPFDGFTGVWRLEGTFEPHQEAQASPGTDPGASADHDPGASADQDTDPGTQPTGQQDGEAAAETERLADTGPAVVPGLALPLLAVAFALMGRRRSQS